ncbi:MAG: helix-turn-helix transcriptional regulator [Clostridiales bacterium]|nr:helix-turn-helix transcriptional regulator [Candidatus Crickella merdequi]
MAEIVTPTEHVGKRIRLYRKKSGYTLLEFSQMIHRSVSAISKYENGMVSIDIDTLFEIAEALEVSISQLLDYNSPRKETAPTTGTNNFFRRSNIFYMYQYSGFDKRTNKCIMEIIPNPDSAEDNVMMYYGVKDTRDYTKCDFLYRGEITYSDAYVNIQASNPYSDVDKISIYAKSSFSPSSTTATGIILTLAESLRNPYAAKVIFSTEPLTVNAELLEELMINDKDSVADFKKSNAMVIY